MPVKRKNTANRDRILKIRISAAEDDMICKLAAAESRDVAEYLRELLRREAAKKGIEIEPETS